MYLIDAKHEQLTGVEILIPVSMFFNLKKVAAVRQVIDDGESEINHDKCAIYMDNNDSFVIGTPYKTILNLLKCK